MYKDEFFSSLHMNETASAWLTHHYYYSRL